MSVTPRTSRSTVNPEALTRLSTLFDNSAESPQIVLGRYWERYAALKEIRLTHSLRLDEMSAHTKTGKRKLEYMQSVCENISTEERDMYLLVAAAAGRLLSEKVLETIAGYPLKVRRRAINEWAKAELTLRPLIKYLQRIAPPGSARKSRKTAKKRTARSAEM